MLEIEVQKYNTRTIIRFLAILPQLSLEAIASFLTPPTWTRKAWQFLSEDTVSDIETSFSGHGNDITSCQTPHVNSNKNKRHSSGFIAEELTQRATCVGFVLNEWSVIMTSWLLRLRHSETQHTHIRFLSQTDSNNFHVRSPPSVLYWGDTPGSLQLRGQTTYE